MPRMTRAAARTQIHEDEPEVDAAEVPLPQTPQPQRPREQLQRSPQRAPLGEITIVPQEEEPRFMLEINLPNPAKKTKGKKGKGGRKPKKADSKQDDSDNQQDEDKENTPEVIEDDIPSRPSSAAEEACADLLKETKQALDDIKRDIRPSTPPSRAVRAARKQLTPRANTPRFNPEAHRSPEIKKGIPEEDSFIESIETRSPAKIISDPFMDSDPGDGTPVTSPSKLSPLKSPRPEDSIEAMDAAEAALEMLGQSLPSIEDDPFPQVDGNSETSVSNTAKIETKPTNVEKPAQKPAKVTNPRKKNIEALPTRSNKKSETAFTVKAVPSKPVTKPLTPRLATARSVPSEPRLATVRPAPASRPTVVKRSASSTVSTGPPTQQSTMPIRHKPRIASINKTPFVPNKSAKPPTTSSFTLPGEAIAARLKEQREKRAEDAAVAAKTNAATSTSQVFRPTIKAATLGRTSSSSVRASLANAKADTVGTLRLAKAQRATILPVQSSAPRRGEREKRVASNTSADSMAVNVDGKSSSAVKRNSTMGRSNAATRTQRLSVVTGSASSASSVASKGSSPSTLATATTLSVATNPTIKRPSYVSKTLPAQCARPKNASVSGRELFERKADTAVATTATVTLTRKEKEEAARKARAEAAERGRLASREWAEKMRARQATAKPVKTSAVVEIEEVNVGKHEIL